MLTSPVNVTIATANGAMLKPQAAASDTGAHRPPLLTPASAVQQQAADAGAGAAIEPELPSNSTLSHVNAVAATAGNRTILQELALSVAAALKITRRPDETLTALFSRIIATIEAMPQAERLQFEVRTGLKALKITLTDLAAALRKPDGPEAARLTAMAEAPSTVPARAAASAATTTYLQEGTADGQAEETLAMRAAARSSAAGQTVFSAESKLRPSDNQPTDGRVLQNQLKTMFEPGESKRPGLSDPPQKAEAAGGAQPSVVRDQAGIRDSVGRDTTVSPAAVREDAAGEARPTASQAQSNTERVAISTANLKLDAQSLDKLRAMAQAIAAQEPAETLAAAVGDEPVTEKTEAGERRAPSVLTIKGLVDAVSALPGKAAEILAQAMIDAEPAMPAAATPAAQEARDPATLQQAAFEDTPLPDLARQPGETPDAIKTSALMQTAAAQAVPVDAETRASGISAEQAAAAAENEDAQAVPERAMAGRPDLLQHAVPFAYAPVQPAREEMIEAVEEEEARRGTEDEDGEADEDAGEKRRPRDEYDAIHDPVEEDVDALVINRDSSEADRAFAMYQRMGGF